MLQIIGRFDTSPFGHNNGGEGLDTIPRHHTLTLEEGCSLDVQLRDMGTRESTDIKTAKPIISPTGTKGADPSDGRFGWPIVQQRKQVVAEQICPI